MGARVPTVPTGVRDGAELLPTSMPRRTETPPPLGFSYNCGPNYMPFIITNNSGRSVPARFTRVIMGADPHVIGMIPGDNNQYGGPLHAAPDHDQGERLGTHLTTCGSSESELTTLPALTLRSILFTTYH